MRILTFDTESSTGRVNDGSLCSIGYCVSDENFNITEQRDVIFRPIAKFRKGIIGMNGKVGLSYPEEEFYAAEKFSFWYDYFAELFASCDLIVGFAIENDVKYLRDACRKYNFKQIKYKFIDVKGLLEVYDDELKTKGLVHIGEAIGENFIAHRSDEDARLTLLTLKYLCKKHNKSLKELLEYADIKCGIVEEKTYSHMYSFSQIYEKNGFKRTARQVSYLFDYAEKTAMKTPKTDKELFRKAFTFSKKIKALDPSVNLGLLEKIYGKNGKYSDGMLSANTFVYLDEEDDDLKKAEKIKATGRKLNIMSYSELKNILGDVPEEKFDYYAVILKREKERARQKSLNKSKKPQSERQP